MRGNHFCMCVGLNGQKALQFHLDQHFSPKMICRSRFGHRLIPPKQFKNTHCDVGTTYLLFWLEIEFVAQELKFLFKQTYIWSMFKTCVVALLFLYPNWEKMF